MAGKRKRDRKAKERTKENCRCFDAADPRPRGCTPLGTPKRKSQGPSATRTQYYCSRLTPTGLPPLLSRGLRGCERGATVERSETGERTMFAPAGQTTARACLLANCRRSLCADKRRARGLPANDRLPYSCGPHMCGPYISINKKRWNISRSIAFLL